MTPRRVAAVALGSIVGATLRWVVVAAVGASDPTWILLAVNTAGCIMVGAAVAWRPADPSLLVTTGVSGAFTTFAGFVADTAALLDDGRALAAGAFCVAGVAAAVAGLATGRFAAETRSPW